MNETIDLCESDSECTSNRRSTKRENEVEVITLDDSSCSTPRIRRNPFLRPRAGTSAKRPKLDLVQVNDDNNNDSDIEIVEVKDVQKPANCTPRRKAPIHEAKAVSAKRRKSKFHTPFIYRGISSNSRVDNLLARVQSSAKKNKAKMKKRRKLQAKKLNTTPNINPGKKTAAQKKKEALREQTRQVLQSQEYYQNTFPGRKIARDRKAKVPLQNGQPKFRMQPFVPQPQLIRRDRILSEPKLIIPPRETNAESTSRIFGTELSETLCKDTDKVDLRAESTSSSDSKVIASSGTSKVLASSTVPDSTNNDSAQDFQRTEISSSSGSLPSSSSTFQSSWSQYGSNIYNSDAGQSKTKGSLRPIVIDGSNVAMA